MKYLTFGAGLALATVGFSMAPAYAGQLVNGWNYSIDSFNDGYEMGTIGANSSFEFYGLAVKETADTVYFGLNSNLSLAGQNSASAADGHIGYGDLFLNFTGDGLDDADGDLYAVRFAQNSDSGAPQLGLYGGVSAKNVTRQNSGFRHAQHHANRVRRKGGTASMGDLEATDAYFQSGVDTNRAMATSIAAGNFLGGISLLNDGDLSQLGLDFAQVDSGVQGRHTFGFSFARSLLPDGDYIAHVLAECINDGLALKGNMTAVVPSQPPSSGESVPEPAAAAGLFLFGGLGLLKRRAS